MTRAGLSLDKILSRTLHDGQCQIWQGHRDRKGYALIRIAGKQRFAHRVAYELAKGPILDGMTIDHICWRPACVNPNHLQPLSKSDNAKRQRSALKTHCVNGHEFTPENTYLRPSGGRRGCRMCIADCSRRYQARKRGVA